MTQVARNCRNVLQRIKEAAVRSGRSPQSIRLIAVTKGASEDHIREAVECGVGEIGENRLQEALTKREALKSADLTWHFIGHLQANKAKKVVANFDWIQSVDRIELAAMLARHAAARPLPVLIEVKLHQEPMKNGVEPKDLDRLASSIRGFDVLQLRGLMAIPPPSDNPEEVRPYFRRLRELAEGLGLPELSMGMTNDFEIAIEEGATMVRIGTAIFGMRR